jgi:hypothetical protein
LLKNGHLAAACLNGNIAGSALLDPAYDYKRLFKIGQIVVPAESLKEA